VKGTSLLLFLLFGWSSISSGQRIGSCPPSPPRSSQNIRELMGVVVDENLAVIPKVKVRLQVPNGEDFRDIAVTDTDSTGSFRFQAQSLGNHRLVFAGPKGFSSVTIPVRYSKAGFEGMRLTLPVAASDSCPQDCDSKLKVEEMTGREGRE
jgi:hypothetical protein